MSKLEEEEQSEMTRAQWDPERKLRHNGTKSWEELEKREKEKTGTCTQIEKTISDQKKRKLVSENNEKWAFISFHVSVDESLLPESCQTVPKPTMTWHSVTCPLIGLGSGSPDGLSLMRVYFSSPAGLIPSKHALPLPLDTFHKLERRRQGTGARHVLFGRRAERRRLCGRAKENGIVAVKVPRRDGRLLSNRIEIDKGRASGGGEQRRRPVIAQSHRRRSRRSRRRRREASRRGGEAVGARGRGCQREHQGRMFLFVFRLGAVRSGKRGEARDQWKGGGAFFQCLTSFSPCLSSGKRKEKRKNCCASCWYPPESPHRTWYSFDRHTAFQSQTTKIAEEWQNTPNSNQNVAVATSSELP